MPPPPSPNNFELFGRNAAQLLYDDPSWVYRRKETVRILDDTWFRRQVSIDYAIPDIAAPHRMSESGDRLYAVPITLMRKSPPSYVDFDMKDEAGVAMALMTREHNARVSLEAMRWAARENLKGVLPPDESHLLPPHVDRLLCSIAEGDVITAGFALRSLAFPGDDEVLAALYNDDRLMWLALAFAEHSVVMVEVPVGDGRRRIIKMSYSERNINRSDRVANQEEARDVRGGLRPYPVFIDSPYIVAGTYHFELEAPPGLEVVDTAMREYGFLDALLPPEERVAYRRPAEDHQYEEAADVARWGTRTHLYAPDATLTDRAEVDVLLRVQREGFVSAAAWAATIIAGLLVTFLIALKPVIQHQGVVPSVLLLFPGAAATLVGQAGDHQLTIRMLNLARRALLVAAGCAFVATVGLALSRTGDGHDPRVALRVIWVIVTVVAIYCAALLQLARRLPRRSPTKRERRAGRLMRPLVNALDARFLRSS